MSRMDTCEVEGCDKPRYGRKPFCRSCYRRAQYNGEYPTLPTRRTRRYCAADGCGEPIDHRAKSDLCREHWLRRDGVRVEEIVYRGITFRRYPDARQGTHRAYYKPGGGDAARGIESLHREIYKDTHGPIPDGFHVHHKDSNPDNNDPTNLVAISPEDHLALTAEGYRGKGPWKDRAAMLAHLADIRPLAAEWHSTPEGIAWHREHAYDSIAKPVHR